MSTEKPVKQKLEKNTKYGKLQLIRSIRYQQEKDLLAALLDSEEGYSTEEVEQLINGYKKGKVK